MRKLTPPPMSAVAPVAPAVAGVSRTGLEIDDDRGLWIVQHWPSVRSTAGGLCKPMANWILSMKADAPMMKKAVVEDPDALALLKDSLPAYTVAAIYEEDRPRQPQHIKLRQPIAILDYDDVGHFTAKLYLEDLRKSPHVVLAEYSISEEGLRVLVHTRNWVDLTDYKLNWEAAHAHVVSVAPELSEYLDKAVSDPSRLIYPVLSDGTWNPNTTPLGMPAMPAEVAAKPPSRRYLDGPTVAVAEYKRRLEALHAISPNGDSAHWERTVRAAASAGLHFSDILDWSDRADRTYKDAHRRLRNIYETNRQDPGAGALFNLSPQAPAPPVVTLEPRKQPWATREELEGTGEPWPALVTRDDGATVVYADALTWVHGEPGCGKSWLGLIFADWAERAILVDWEAAPQICGERSNLLGTWPTVQQDELFRYYNGQVLFEPTAEGEYPTLMEAIDWVSEQNELLSHGPGKGLVVLDAASSGGCPADGDEVYSWLQRHVTPFRRRGVAVVVIDHVPKRKEGRPDGAIGSFGKEAAPDLSLRVIGQPWNASTGGHVTLMLSKDRFGHLPATKGNPVATVHGSWENGAFGWKLTAPLEAPREATLRHRIVATLREHGAPMSQRQIREGTRGKTAALADELKLMVDDGLVDHADGGYFLTGEL